MRQLSALDALFLHIEQPNAAENATSVWLYDRSTAPGGKLSFDDVVDHFAQRMHLMDALRMKLVRVPGNLDRPYWVEDQNFDLEYHMRNIALPPPGDWRQFCRQLARIHERHLDFARPLWELYMIEGLDAIDNLPKGSCAIVLKMHHAAADGKALTDIVNAVHSPDPENRPPPPHETQAAEPEPSAWELLIRSGINAARRPFEALPAIGRVLPGLGQVALPTLSRELRELIPQVLGDNHHAILPPRTRFAVPVSPHRSVGVCFFDFADIKPIRKAVEGATVGDVVTSVFGGALRIYLGETGELPAEPLNAMMPVAVHSAKDPTGLGNQFSMMVATLATDIEDPLERLAAVRASTSAAKSTGAAIGSRNVTELLNIVPDAVFPPAIRAGTLTVRPLGGIGSVVSTMVSGFPGPPRPLYLAGAKLVHLIGLGPLGDGMTLINVYYSYNGELLLAFTACRDAMPNPERYEECIYEAFAQLRTAVRSGSEDQ